MPNTDSVSVFAIGADVERDKPIAVYDRARCREMKKANEGYFASRGNVFLLSGPKVPEIPVDGLLGKGVIPFVRIVNKMVWPPKLHYPIPACGARNRVLHAYQVNQEYENELSEAFA